MGQRFLLSLPLAMVGIKLFLQLDAFHVRVLNVMLVGGVYHAAPSTPFIQALHSRPVQFLGRIIQPPSGEYPADLAATRTVPGPWARPFRRRRTRIADRTA